MSAIYQNQNKLIADNVFPSGYEVYRRSVDKYAHLNRSPLFKYATQLPRQLNQA